AYMDPSWPSSRPVARPVRTKCPVGAPPRRAYAEGGRSRGQSAATTRRRVRFMASSPIRPLLMLACVVVAVGTVTCKNEPAVRTPATGAGGADDIGTGKYAVCSGQGGNPA